jgi:hypothetical protein
MNLEIIETVRFVGFGISLFASIMYFRLFLKIIEVKDGIGLEFLKVFTISLFICTAILTIIRFIELYVGDWNIELSPVILTINPIIFLSLSLYLNYMFHRKSRNNKK